MLYFSGPGTCCVWYIFPWVWPHGNSWLVIYVCKLGNTCKHLWNDIYHGGKSVVHWVTTSNSWHNFRVEAIHLSLFRCPTLCANSGCKIHGHKVYFLYNKSPSFQQFLGVCHVLVAQKIHTINGKGELDSFTVWASRWTTYYIVDHLTFYHIIDHLIILYIFTLLLP